MKTATRRKLSTGPPKVSEEGAGTAHLVRPTRHHPAAGLSTPRTSKSIISSKASGAGSRTGERQEDLELAREFAARVRAQLGTGVVAVRWFGSRRAGVAGPDSDVDLLLETEAVLTPAQRDLVLDTSVEMAATYGCVLDVHYYTRRELQSRTFRRTPFVISVLSEGAVI